MTALVKARVETEINRVILEMFEHNNLTKWQEVEIRAFYLAHPEMIEY